MVPGPADDRLRLLRRSFRGRRCAGVRAHLDYLAELGVTYLHLMPLLKPRDGRERRWLRGGRLRRRRPAHRDDGRTDRAGRRPAPPRYGAVRRHGAQPHRARARLGPARRPPAIRSTAASTWSIPIAANPTRSSGRCRTSSRTFAPGNFTYDAELGGWVWTTFNPFQWDLNYANPDVFRVMLRTMLSLANRGVDVLRLDAAPFLWKRLGTNCMNQPETHLLLQAFRALTRLAAPGLLLKAEAMVAPGPAREVPRRPRRVPARMRSRLRQPAHGDALVSAWPPATPGSPRRH